MLYYIKYKSIKVMKFINHILKYDNSMKRFKITQ